MFAFLNKPYPIDIDIRKIIFNNICIGVFIFLFLAIFQPFGISVWEVEYKILKLSGFGVISCLVPLIYQLIKNVLFLNTSIEDNWTVWKEILSNCFVLTLIATANLFYIASISNFSISLSLFVSCLLMVLAIAAFPVGWITYRKLDKFLQLNQTRANEINKELFESGSNHIATKSERDYSAKEKYKNDEIHKNDIEELVSSEKTNKSEAISDIRPTEVLIEDTITSTLIFTADNEKDKLEIKAEDFYYMESQDNYTAIVFLNDSGIKRVLFRSSLSRLFQQINFKLITRCHRSFIIDLSKVESLEGNAAGYKLTLKNLTEKIPVSRSYAKEVITVLKARKFSSF